MDLLASRLEEGVSCFNGAERISGIALSSTAPRPNPQQKSCELFRIAPRNAIFVSMKDDEIAGAFTAIRTMSKSWSKPLVQGDRKVVRDPFRVLISCIISLRTRDEVTGPASERLFRLASDPGAMSKLSDRAIEKAIYPAGFYRNKARQIARICRELVEYHESKVPATVDELLQFKGVGRKTANMVVTAGHNRPGICVDIHVHRITNRWGYVSTNSPDETEMVLREKLPRRYWKGINRILVLFGQQICRPLSPLCTGCTLAGRCARNGVKKSR